MNKIKTIIIGLIGIALLGFKAEETPLEKLLKQLVKITDNYPQEKIHLHLDKPYYAIGEEMWFKAYVVTAEKKEPSLLSNVLYIDLINDKNEVAKKAKLEVINGYANGNINLIDSLTTGIYRIRAYTNYMRNYDASFFFEKTINIVNVLDKDIVKFKKENPLELSLKFFPEGGKLVTGIRSKVGIKALSSDGLGLNLSGYIVNKSKVKVAEFTTEFAGMGVFAFTPLPEEKYTAIVQLENGITKEFDVPKVEENGYVFSINHTESELTIRISLSSKLVDGKELYVVGQANGKSYASFASKIDNSSVIAKLDKKLFPTGIVHFTLFDQLLNPISERLIFVNHNDSVKINIVNKSLANLIKKKAEFNVAITDINNEAIEGNYSIAVTDMDLVKLDENEETTILSNLLLTSDLKGFIEKPNYYFNTKNPDREKHLDNLLLTQGWSRFVWKDINNQAEPTITFRPEQSLEISGKIFNQYNKPLTNAKVSLFSTTPGLILKLDTISDIKGNFVFDRLDLPYSASFIFQATDRKKSKDVKITINEPPIVNKSTFYGLSYTIEPYIENSKKMFQEMIKYNMMNSSILLNTVEIKSKSVLKPLLNVPNSANASGAADQVITEKMLVGAINIYSIFYKTPGVIVRNGLIYGVRGRTSMSSAQKPMLLIVDGVILPPDFLPDINPMDIAGIEVLSSAYNSAVYGDDGAGGVIHITNKKGGIGKGAAATNTAKVSNVGFNVIKEFYSPDYDDPKTNQQFQDLRSTIYWNPKLITDKSGTANFDYFNASTPGNYRITIEGIDAFGNIGRKVYTYEVK